MLSRAAEDHRHGAAVAHRGHALSAVLRLVERSCLRHARAARARCARRRAPLLPARSAGQTVRACSSTRRSVLNTRFGGIEMSNCLYSESWCRPAPLRSPYKAYMVISHRPFSPLSSISLIVSPLSIINYSFARGRCRRSCRLRRYGSLLCILCTVFSRLSNSASSHACADASSRLASDAAAVGFLLDFQGTRLPVRSACRNRYLFENLCFEGTVCLCTLLSKREINL